MTTLRELRTKQGMTQAAAAAAMGISQPAYATWETGASRPPLEKLKPLAALYGVDTDELVDILTAAYAGRH